MHSLNPLVNAAFCLFIFFSILVNFIFIGSRWLENYIYAFAAESWIIAILSAGIGYFTQTVDLYFIAGLTILFRGVILPYLLNQMIKKLDIKHEIHSLLPASFSLILCTILVIFSFVIATHLAQRLFITNSIIVLALTATFSMELTGFLLLSIRDQAISKVLALLVLENGMFLGSQFLVPGMPILIELIVLFDLLIVVISFGVLMRYLQMHVGSTSTKELQQLVG